MKDLFEYRRAMDTVHADAQQKEQLVHALMDGQKKSTHRTTHRTFRRTALTAAALAAILIVGVGATEILKSASQIFSDVFGSEPAVTQMVDQIGYPVNASDTDNGMTITADAVVCDGGSIYISYTLSFEDISVLDLEHVDRRDNGTLALYFEGYDHNLYADSSVGWGLNFWDPDPSDNSIQILYRMSCTDSNASLYLDNMLYHTLYGENVLVTKFQNLCRIDSKDTGYELTPLVKGTWKLKFNVNFEDSSIKWNANCPVPLDGISLNINQIQISPLSVKLSGIGKRLVDDLDTSLDFPVTLVKTDGTTLPLHFTCYGVDGMTPEGEDNYHASLLYPYPIAVDSISALRIGETEIPVP